MPRATIVTLGCRLNQAESALIHERLMAAGYDLVPARDPVDLGIINTCTVTGEADAKCRKAIRAFIRSHPNAFVAVVGCMSQLYAHQIAQIPGVDLVMGNANKLDLLQHVQPQKLKVPKVFANPIPNNDFKIEPPRKTATDSGFSSSKPVSVPAFRPAFRPTSGTDSNFSSSKFVSVPDSSDSTCSPKPVSVPDSDITSQFVSVPDSQGTHPASASSAPEGRYKSAPGETRGNLDSSDPSPVRASQTFRANLKIQEGCDCMCSYCIVPYARGNPRSRHLDNLLDEATSLVARGVKEIILTGINVGAYAYNGNTILHVADRLNEIPGLARIRISSIELSTIPLDLLDRMNDPAHALVPFLHVPLQSGCDRTLAAMRRTYTAAQFRAFIDHARAAVTDLCIGADVMVGFPGETDQDFEDSCRFVHDGPIDYAHVFKFSPRPGTPAADMPDPVDPRDQNARSQRMREISDAKRQAFHQRHAGRTFPVLFETQASGNWYGYTPNYIRVAVPSRQNLANTLAHVQLHQSQRDIMIASLVKESP